MSDQNFKVVELDSIKMEDGAKELMTTPEMQPCHPSTGGILRLAAVPIPWNLKRLRGDK